MKPLIDYHMHSTFSYDGHSTIEEMCETALQKGLIEIGFSEHYEMHPESPEYCLFSLEAWAKEIERCRGVFGPRGLCIRAGIEMAEPHLYQEETAKILSSYDFDYAFGSVHAIGDETYFDQNFFVKYGEEQGFQLYFRELQQLLQDGDFDILAHLDAPARISSRVFGNYDPRRFESLIRPVLDACIKRGIAIEINNGGRRTALKRSTPDREILAWYLEMGGTRITFGSDAHRATHIGYEIESSLEMASEVGFRDIGRFSRRQIEMLEIVS